MTLQNKHSSLSEYVIIIFLGLVLFVPFIGQAHLFDWDEANFGEAAREMVITNNWLNPLIDYQLFWEKPPVFIWMQAICMKIFGINEFAARFPNSIMGAVTLCAIFYIGKRVSGKRMAWIWVFLYLGTWLTHFYFKSAIIDPTFNFFIFLSFYQLYRAIDTGKTLPALLTGFFAGIAVLTKGPVAVLILGVCGLIYIIIRKRFFIISIGQYIALILSMFVTIFLWLGIDIYKNGTWFTETFLVYQYRLFSTQDAGHGGPWYYHPLVLIIGCFPSSVFFLQAVFKKTYWKGQENKNDFYLLMSLMFFAHLIIFSVVKTKIIHYSSLCYFPLTFWAAVEIDRLFKQDEPLKKPFRVLGYCIGSLIGLSILLLPVLGKNKDLLMENIKDRFVTGNLQADIRFEYYEMVFGLMVIIAAVTIIYSVRRKALRMLYFSVFAQAILISTVVSYFAPRIEAFSQGGAIHFYKKAKEDDMLVYTHKMKSYAYLFYSDKQPQPEHSPKNVHEVLSDADVQHRYYIVSKNIHKDEILTEHPALHVVDERAGYVLYAFNKKTD